MGKFHITITDKETQETLIDVDTNAIIAGIDEPEGTRGLCLTECSVINHAAVLLTLQDIIDKNIKDNTLLGTLVVLTREKLSTETTEE